MVKVYIVILDVGMSDFPNETFTHEEWNQVVNFQVDWVYPFLPNVGDSVDMDDFFNRELFEIEKFKGPLQYIGDEHYIVTSRHFQKDAVWLHLENSGQ